MGNELKLILESFPAFSKSKHFRSFLCYTKLSNMYMFVRYLGRLWYVVFLIL